MIALCRVVISINGLVAFKTYTHIEAVYGYDTCSFLMAFRRFACIRGWPEYIYSDPGSQLIGAERELKEAWEKIDRSELHKNGVENGLTWVFG